MLRIALLIFGGLLLFAGFLLLARPPLLGIALYLGVYGLVIVGGILLERSGYQPRVNRKRGLWQQTGERFVDPTSGRLTDVYFNPETGERDYREAPKT